MKIYLLSILVLISSCVSSREPTVFRCVCRGIDLGNNRTELRCQSGPDYVAGDIVCANNDTLRYYLRNERTGTSTNLCRTNGAYDARTGWQCRNLSFCGDREPCKPTQK